MALACNCKERCWCCDEGREDEECTCFEPCPVHQPGAFKKDLSRFSSQASRELERNRPEVKP